MLARVEQWALRGQKECPHLLPCLFLWCKYSHQSWLHVTNIDDSGIEKIRVKLALVSQCSLAKPSAELHHWRPKSTECDCEVKLFNSSVLSTTPLFYMIKIKKWGTHGCPGNCQQESSRELEMVHSRNVAERSFPFSMVAEVCFSLLFFR